jgi:hypothetical protein
MTQPFEGSGFGRRLTIRLLPDSIPDSKPKRMGQSGGTEQAEVIVEPDS